MKNSQATAPAPVTPVSSEDIEKAKASLEEKISALNRQTAKAPAPAPSARKTATQVAAPAPAPPVAPEAPPVSPKPLNPTDVNYPGIKLGLKPMESPSLPISTDVQSRLQALDAKYKAGEITPEEYHTQRAAILAAP
jgi:hypothetical protein